MSFSQMKWCCVDWINYMRWCTCTLIYINFTSFVCSGISNESIFCIIFMCRYLSYNNIRKPHALTHMMLDGLICLLHVEWQPWSQHIKLHAIHCIMPMYPISHHIRRNNPIRWYLKTKRLLNHRQMPDLNSCTQQKFVQKK